VSGVTQCYTFQSVSLNESLWSDSFCMKNFVWWMNILMIDMFSNHVNWNHCVSSINIQHMSTLHSNQPLFLEGRCVGHAVDCRLLTAVTRLLFHSIQNMWWTKWQWVGVAQSVHCIKYVTVNHSCLTLYRLWNDTDYILLFSLFPSGDMFRHLWLLHGSRTDHPTTIKFKCLFKHLTFLHHWRYYPWMLQK
jgi:hypothetical protein